MARRRGSLPVGVGTRSSKRLESTGKNRSSVDQKSQLSTSQSLQRNQQPSLIPPDISNTFGMSDCPECRFLFNGSTHRAVQESCGHIKCRSCLIENDYGCIQCKNGQNPIPVNNHEIRRVPNSSLPFNLGENFQNNLGSSETINSKALRKIGRKRKSEHQEGQDSAAKVRNMFPAPIIPLSGAQQGKGYSNGMSPINNGVKSNVVSHNRTSTTFLQEILANQATIKKTYSRTSKRNDMKTSSDPASSSAVGHDILPAVHETARLKSVSQKPSSLKNDSLNTICPEQLQALQLPILTGSSFSIDGFDTSFETGDSSSGSVGDKKKKKRSPVSIPEHIKILVRGQPKMYQCSICDKKFKTKAHIKYHEYCKNGKTKFRCAHCGQGFIAKSHYEYHLRTHTGERPYRCEYPKCGKGFNQRGNVTRHMRSHTGEKPFICRTCGRGFANAQALRCHQLTHTGKRPFACQHCSKTFTCMTNLKKHITTHTGAKPYMCEHCGKGFGLKWTLEVHMRTHSNDRPYACDQCKRAFSNTKDLRRHVAIHSGERPYTCMVCKTAFGRKDNLDRHIKNTHNLSKNESKRLANEAAAKYLASKKAKAKADDVSNSTNIAHPPPPSSDVSETATDRPSTPMLNEESELTNASVIITAEMSPPASPLNTTLPLSLELEAIMNTIPDTIVQEHEQSMEKATHDSELNEDLVNEKLVEENPKMDDNIALTNKAFVVIIAGEISPVLSNPSEQISEEGEGDNEENDAVESSKVDPVAIDETNSTKEATTTAQETETSNVEQNGNAKLVKRTCEASGSNATEEPAAKVRKEEGGELKNGDVEASKVDPVVLDETTTNEEATTISQDETETTATVADGENQSETAHVLKDGEIEVAITEKEVVAEVSPSKIEENVKVDVALPATEEEIVPEVSKEDLVVVDAAANVEGDLGDSTVTETSTKDAAESIEETIPGLEQISEATCSLLGSEADFDPYTLILESPVQNIPHAMQIHETFNNIRVEAEEPSASDNMGYYGSEESGCLSTAAYEQHGDFAEFKPLDEAHLNQDFPEGKVWTRNNDLLKKLFRSFGDNVVVIFAAVGTTVDVHGKLRLVFTEALGCETVKHQNNELHHSLLYTSSHPFQLNNVPGELVDVVDVMELQTSSLYKPTMHPFIHVDQAKREMKVDICKDDGVSITVMRVDLHYLHLLASCEDREIVPYSFFYLYPQNVPTPGIVDTHMIQKPEPIVNVEMVRKFEINALVGEMAMARKAMEEERNNREYHDAL